VCYPEEWYVPKSSFEKGMDQLQWTPHRYSPYKRISHFREHLNRLQFCQYVTIPAKVTGAVQHYLKSMSPHTAQEKQPVLYYAVKQVLKEHGFSNYNEHIHYLLSQCTRRHLTIPYEDRALMCTLFIQMDHQFRQCQKQVQGLEERKNIFSYYLIIQMMLYLFHIHPSYQLPSLLDKQKRGMYYLFLFKLFVETPLYYRIMTLHFIRKKKCRHCNEGSGFTDSELIQYC
jgi:hypothetical protein